MAISPYLAGSILEVFGYSIDLIFPLWAWFTAIGFVLVGCFVSRPSTKTFKHRVEIILMRDGVNVHRTIDLTESEIRNYGFKNSEKQHSFKVNDLWAVQRSSIGRSLDKRIGILSRWVAVFEKDKTKPLGLNHGSKQTKKTKDAEGKEKEVEIPPISAELLRVVEQSSILKAAFKGMFRTPLGGKKVILIGIIFVFIVFGVLVATGEINLEGLFTAVEG